MATEKTPALYSKKVPFDYDQPSEKFCSRATISWVLGSILVTLVIIVSIEFLYPARIGINEDSIHLLEEQPFEVRVLSPGNSDSTTDDKEHANMNPWDFNFLIDPAHLCITRNPPNSIQYQNDPEVKLLMLVQSSVEHFEQRKVIRNTWGSIAEKPLGPMRLGFVLGSTDNKTISDLILEESSQFRDIIQADFVDSYHQPTTKSVLMLKWVAKRCPHAQFFLKADDDTFINVGLIANILGTEPFISQNKFIGGYVHTGAQPSRIPQEKYYISEEDYPFNEYPPYASGSAYVMTGPTAVGLFDASKEVEPFLQLEDVFVTGLCAQHIDAPRIHDPRFLFDDPPIPPSWDAYSSLASAHSVTPDALEAVWNDMTQSVLSVFSQLLNQEAAINSSVLIRMKRNL